MTVAYDGAPYHGFARNEGVPTVAGTLETALGQVLGHPVELACAGRTDKGVHARGQVVSFEADENRIDPPRLVRAVNRMCGPTIAVRDAVVVSDDFDARLSCTGRAYRYGILNAEIPDPLQARWSWHVEQPLDMVAMETATETLLGSHDFSSFCRRNRSRPDESLVRRVASAGWQDGGGLLCFDIEANAFCHQMVRSLVGTLVEVGRGRRRAAAMGEILEARDRAAAAGPAPPHGLVLVAARYADQASNPR
jgi:tRNA pseudouridine38-40 synthase